MVIGDGPSASKYPYLKKIFTANMPKPPESSVSDDICDGFSGKGVLSDLDIL